MNITAIAIVAIICWAIVELTNGAKTKKKSKVSQQKETELEQPSMDIVTKSNEFIQIFII